jgi:predicted aconitase
MNLTAEEGSLLAGEAGEAVRRAMQIIVTLGRIYEADSLLPVGSVQVAGVSYRNLGDAGLEFLRDWAAQGARVRVPTTLNPAGMDLQAWRSMGISEAFAAKQNETVAIYEAMGVRATCTCTPYLVGNVPAYGEHVAWSESSAVVLANSLLGARTNREGGPSALAAAIAGRTAAYGLHLDAERRATHYIQVRCPVHSAHEYAALGYLVGQLVGDGIPYLVGLDLPPINRARVDAWDDGLDALKLMGAAMASSGAVALYHIEGVTPEARERNDLLANAPRSLTIDSLQPALAALNTTVTDIDLVAIGCPHASLVELRHAAEALRGKHIRSALWMTTSRQVQDEGQSLGLVQAIEGAGGQVVADGCVIVAPMSDLPYRTLATNSAKMATYAWSHAGLRVRFGPLDDCLRAALTGRWEPSSMEGAEHA